MSSITISKDDATPFLVRTRKRIENSRGLMEAMGDRLQEELQGHFLNRNQEPNKNNWPKQNFWEKMSDSTGIYEVTDDSATVAIADYRIRMKVFGGTIVPTNGEWLTIPIHELAYGRRVAQLREMGIKLFRPGKKGDKKKVLWGKYNGEIVAFYALAKSVTMPADQDALPSDELLTEAMGEEVNSWIDFEGGDT